MTRRRPGPLQLAVLAITALAACWALATPLGAVPDEPAHLVYAAAVVRGQLGGGPGGLYVRVPQSVARSPSATCTAFRPQVPASCQHRLSRSRRLVTARTTAGRYSPLFYVLVGWPTLTGFDETRWYLMRLLSVLLCGALLAVGAAAWRDPPGSVVVGLLLAATPMATFLAGSVNPSGAEVCAGIGFGLAGTALFRSWSRRAAACTAVAGGYLALARPGSYLLTLALGGVLAVFGWRELRAAARRAPRELAGCVGGLLAAMVAGAVFPRPLGPGPVSAAFPIGAGALLRQAAGSALGWLSETVGMFGWLDHQPSPLLRYSWVAAGLALVALALAVGATRQRLALALLLGGALLVAPYFALVTVFRDGLGYQARYSMALTQCLPVLAGAVLARPAGEAALRLGRTGRRVLGAVPAAWFLLTLVAMAGSVLRYAEGLPLPANPVHVVSRIRWLPPAAVVCVLLLAGAAWLCRLLRRQLLPSGAAA